MKPAGEGCGCGMGAERGHEICPSLRKISLCHIPLGIWVSTTSKPDCSVLRLGQRWQCRGSAVVFGSFFPNSRRDKWEPLLALLLAGFALVLLQRRAG